MKRIYVLYVSAALIFAIFFGIAIVSKGKKQEKQAWLKEIVAGNDDDGDDEQQQVGDQKRQKLSDKKTKEKKGQTVSAVDVIFDALSILSSKEQKNAE